MMNPAGNGFISSFDLIHNDLSDLGSLVLIDITPKEHTLSFSTLYFTILLSSDILMVLIAVIFNILITFAQLCFGCCSQANIGTFRIAFTVSNIKGTLAMTIRPTKPV